MKTNQPLQRDVKDAAKKVKGGKALVENIKVKFPNSWNKTDAEVTNEVLTDLKNNWSVPNNKVSAKIEKDGLTLEGELPGSYQKEADLRGYLNLAFEIYCR